MRLALATLALALPAASSAEAPPAPKSVQLAGPNRLCSDPFKPRPAKPLLKAEARRLGELPPADLTLAVVDKVGGCIEPRVVRQGIGAAAR